VVGVVVVVVVVVVGVVVNVKKESTATMLRRVEDGGEAGFSEMLIPVCQTVRRHILKDSSPQQSLS